MTSHLSSDEIAQYLDGRSSSADLLRVDDHLAGCPACRRQFGAAARVAAGAASIRDLFGRGTDDMQHPAYDQIVAYVDATLDDVDRETLESHLDDCRTCAEDVDDLRAVAVAATAEAGRQPAAVVPIRTARRFWYAAAGLAAAAAIAGILVWTGRSAPPAAVDNGPVRTAERVTPSIVLTLKDGAGTVTLDASGTVTGIQDLDQNDRDRLVAALRDRRAEVPPAIVSLRGQRGALMGAPTAPATMDLVRPLATAVDSAQPIFEWTALPGATSYIVSVFDDALAKVTESEPLTVLQWTPPAPLARGRAYVWQVRARTATDDITVPAPPAPEARFLVLSDADANRVETIRKAYAGSPLALGVLLADAGLVADATRQLEAVVAANPDSQDAQQLLASVKEAGSGATNRRR